MTPDLVARLRSLAWPWSGISETKGRGMAEFDIEAARKLAEGARRAEHDDLGGLAQHIHDACDEVERLRTELAATNKGLQRHVKSDEAVRKSYLQERDEWKAKAERYEAELAATRERLGKMRGALESIYRCTHDSYARDALTADAAAERDREEGADG